MESLDSDRWAEWEYQHNYEASLRQESVCQIVKDMGGVRAYRQLDDGDGASLRTEYRLIPLWAKNRYGLPLDEMAERLAAGRPGLGITCESELVAALIDEGQRPTVKPVRVRPEPKVKVSILENKEKHGLEIRFPVRPAEYILAKLRADGWRWSQLYRCWWQKWSFPALQFTERLKAA